jgi:DOPA 4,5-dioxygenase
MTSEDYHIHFYGESMLADKLYNLWLRLLAEVLGLGGAGKVRRGPVGPHPIPMFEAWFAASVLPVVKAWAEANRDGLSVLIHPLSGDELADHTAHAQWLGEPVELDLGIFRG